MPRPLLPGRIAASDSAELYMAIPGVRNGDQNNCKARNESSHHHNRLGSARIGAGVMPI